MNISNDYLNKWYINKHEKNYDEIIKTFKEANATELPVVKGEKVEGILNLFKILEYDGKSIIECMESDIYIHKKGVHIENINKKMKSIIPVEDENKKYIGFYDTNKVETYIFFEKREKEIVEEFKIALDSSYDGIHITDGQGKTLFFNNACERIEGIKREEIIGKNMKEMVESGIYSESVALEVLKSGKAMRIMQKVNGKDIIAEASPIYSHGEIKKVIINSRDITELNNTKRELKVIEDENKIFKSELEILRQEKNTNKSIVICSPKMEKILSTAKKVALVDSTALICGESGVGKGVLSKFIHDNSNRKKNAFIKIDCGAIPESLLESELFGFEKGAFTGAGKDGKVGLVELANKGTLFLDEIGELPFNLQSKLLRLIQDREFYRIGGKQKIPVDIRIIAATNKNLELMVEKKEFRKDLYYRLNVVPIHIPSLNERKEDICPLIVKFMNTFNKKYGLKKEISQEVLDVLLEYSWPGNVRELENVIERLIVMSNKEIIKYEDIPRGIINNVIKEENVIFTNAIISYKDLINSYEKKILLHVMDVSNSTMDMGEKLGLDRSTVRRKLRKHDIEIKFKK